MKMKQKNYSKFRSIFVVMMCLIIGTIGSTSAFAAESDIPAKGWDRLIGGSGVDGFTGVIPAGDSDFIAVGNTVDNPKNPNDVTTGDTDGMLVKTDDRGTTAWTKFVGGTGNDELNAVAKLSDGSILAAGSSNSSASGDINDTTSGGQDGLLAKFNSDGVLLWTKLIGGTGKDIFNDVIPTADGGFLAVGESYSSATGKITDKNNGNGTNDGFIIKFDSNGDIQWDNLFGSPEYDKFNCVIQTSDGGFVAAGNANGGANGTNTGGEITDLPPYGLMPNDGLLVKFDASGTMVWNNLFGSVGADNFYGITGTSDGGFLVVGFTYAVNGDVTTGESSGQSTALAAKFNSAGTAQWNRAFSGGGYPCLKDVTETKTGNYVTVGKLFGGSSNGINDGLIANLGATGNVISYSNFGGAYDDEFDAFTVRQNGTIVAVGNSKSSQSGTVLNKSNGSQDGLMSYFGQSSYHVTFNENGGTNIGNQIVSYGDHAVVPEPFQRSGYTFEGWYVDEDFSEPFSLSDPILEDTTLYAKWYIHITMDNIVSDDRSINGFGEPGLSVIVSLTNGTKVQTIVKPDGTWSIDLPKDYVLKAGKKVIAVMYDNSKEGMAVSAAEKLVTAAETPPDTGDREDLFPVWLFGLFLGLIIMRRAFKGPKITRRY